MCLWRGEVGKEGKGERKKEKKNIRKPKFLGVLGTAGKRCGRGYPKSSVAGPT